MSVVWGHWDIRLVGTDGAGACRDAGNATSGLAVEPWPYAENGERSVTVEVGADWVRPLPRDMRGSSYA